LRTLSRSLPLPGNRIRSLSGEGGHRNIQGFSALLGFAPKTLADISADTAKIAGAVGASGRGEEVVSQMQGHIEAVPDRIALPRPKLFCEEWGKPLIVSQPLGCGIGGSCRRCVLRHAGRQISAEEVPGMDPEVWRAAWCGAGDRVPLEKIMAERKRQGIRPVRACLVYWVPTNV
jgi:iron complex transport system substrate-binding protein